MAEPTSKLPEEDRANIRSDLGKRETFNSSSTAGGSRNGGASSTTGSAGGGASSSTSAPEKGYFNQTGDIPGRLKSAEESPEDIDDDKVGNGYNPDSSDQTSKGRARFRITRRKAVIGIGGTTVVSLVFGFFSVVSGPAQIVQLSEILQKQFKSMDQPSSNRLNKLLGDAGAQDIGETRVGLLGRQYLRNTLQQLNDAGIEFKTNATGGIIETTVDTNKLAGQYSELNDLSASERQAWLASHYELSPNEINSLGGNKFSIDVRDFGIRATSVLKDKSVALLGDGSVTTALKTRILGKYFNLPSLFHPIELAQASVLDKLTNATARRAAEEDAVQTEISDPIETNTAGLRASLKSKLSGGFSDSVNKILVPTTALCDVHSAADDAVKFNHEAIVVPAALEAVRLVSIGEQVKQGQDISVQQVGSTVQSLTDSSGKSIWSGKALRSISGESPGGPDLPSSYGQAFSNKTTADNIRSATSIKDPVTGVDVTGVACSTPGQIVQAFVNLAILAANAPDGESGGFAAYAAEKAASTAAAVGVTALFINQFTNLVKDKAVVPSVLSGPLGGNLAAFGARAAGNLAAISSGGIALAGSATSVVGDNQQQDQQQFRSESFFARTFNVYDYRSLAGKLADSFSPSLTHNFASLTDNLTSTPTSLFSNLFSPFMPHTQAASNYDWGFPQYGIPSDLLDDPAVANPYDNAKTVANTLNAGDSTAQDLIQRAENCFGVTVSNSSGAWDVVPQNDVNPDDSSYTGADCGGYKTDANWARMIMFVFDTMTMKADACYQGDDQSCSDLGIQSGGSGGSTPAPVTNDISAYKNPLRDVMQNGSLVPRRIDEGVDYGGHGQIYAMGTGTVTFAGTGEWFGAYGQSVVYELTDGPAKGMSVYFSESCTPTVRKGDPVTPDTVICNMHGDNDPWIETGWAVGGAANQDIPSAHIGYNECATVYGANYSDLLKKLGAPGGKVECGGPDETLPAGWPTW